MSKKKKRKGSHRYQKQKAVKTESEDRTSLKKRLPLIITGALFLVLFVAMLIILPGKLKQNEADQTDAQVTGMQTAEPEASAEPDEKALAYEKALSLLEKADAGDASALSMIGKSEADVPEDSTAAMLLYQAALESFESMDGYQDSKIYAARCRDGIAAQEQAVLQKAYDRASTLLEDRHYSEARRQFLALSDFSDSTEMAKEAIYRKAAALFDVIRNYDVREIYAVISMDPEQKSSIVLPGSNAPTSGSPVVQAAVAACGNDPAEIVTTEGAEQGMLTLADSVKGLFDQLEGYRDSAACIEAILEATDYSKEFYRYIGEGKLQEAMEWLNAFNGEFEDRAFWQERLEIYIPYCASWSLHSGDKTVIPFSVGRSSPCFEIETVVTFDENEDPILHLTAYDGDEEYGQDFWRETDESLFYNDENPKYNSMLVINNVGRLSYMLYKNEGGLVTSAEYRRD